MNVFSNLKDRHPDVARFVRRLVEVVALRQLSPVGFEVFRHRPVSRVGRDGLPLPRALVGGRIVGIRRLFVDFQRDFLGGVRTILVVIGDLHNGVIEEHGMVDSNRRSFLKPIGRPRWRIPVDDVIKRNGRRKKTLLGIRHSASHTYRPIILVSGRVGRLHPPLVPAPLSFQRHFIQLDVATHGRDHWAPGIHGHLDHGGRVDIVGLRVHNTGHHLRVPVLNNGHKFYPYIAPYAISPPTAPPRVISFNFRFLPIIHIINI